MNVIIGFVKVTCFWVIALASFVELQGGEERERPTLTLSLLKSVVQVKAYEGDIEGLIKQLELALDRPEGGIKVTMPEFYRKKKVKIELPVVRAMTLARIIGEYLGASTHGEYPFKFGRREIIYTFPLE